MLNATAGNAGEGDESSGAGPSNGRLCRGLRDLDRFRRKKENEFAKSIPLSPRDGSAP